MTNEATFSAEKKSQNYLIYSNRSEEMTLRYHAAGVTGWNLSVCEDIGIGGKDFFRKRSAIDMILHLEFIEATKDEQLIRLIFSIFN